MRSTRQLFVCAAAGLACVLTLAGACWAVYSCEMAGPDDYRSGIFERVEFSADYDGLVLINATNIIPYLWIPSPDAGTVSKIDARTGRELARYRMGPADAPWWPGSVTTDTEGNAYIACGCGASGGRIVRILAGPDSIVRSDRQVVTSWDQNSNCQISTSEMLPWGRDELVGPVIDLGEAWPTCVAMDDAGYLWVGLWGEQSIVKVDPRKGKVSSKVFVAGRPSTMVVGPSGSIWVLSRDANTLSEVSAVSGTLKSYADLHGSAPESMCMDAEGILWMGSHKGLLRFDTRTHVLSKYETDSGEGLSGVTVDPSGDIWAACPNRNQVIHYSRDTMKETATVGVGKRPGAMSTDGDGYVWVLNEGSATASRIDYRDDTRTASATTGPGPACNTQFVGSLVKRGMSPNGNWRVIVDSRLDGAGWGTLDWETSGVGKVEFQVRSAPRPDVLADQPWVDVQKGVEFGVPNNRYLEVQARLTGSGSTTPVLRRLAVAGRNLPPDVSRAVPTSTHIWRADGTLEQIAITGVTDPEGDPYTIAITGVTQDEPVTGLFPNDVGPDATETGRATIGLRADRADGTPDHPANGRVYVVTFKATDALGASSVGTVKVTVPVSMARGDDAVDDGQKFDSTKKPVPKMVAKG